MTARRHLLHNPRPATARQPAPGQRPCIGLALTQGLSFLEKARRGIVDYAQAHGGWTFYFTPEALVPPVEWLCHMRLDGAFALVTNTADKRTLRALPFPTINLAGHINPSKMPSVMVDHRRTGRMAAEHLLKLGFTRLAYYGAENMWYSRQRQAGFVSAAREAKIKCCSLVIPAPNSASAYWRDQQRQLVHWLQGLKPPVGIMASIDLRAAMIVDACAQLGLRVPDDVAVLGVDNDETVCQLGPVSLTSIARNDWKVGWEAAALLDQMMKGTPPPAQPVYVEPERVVVRKSTETIAVHDAFIAHLIAEMRANLQKHFGVEWLVQRTKRSRRWLELRFREVMGQPPHVVINRLRVAKAREMLGSPQYDHLTLTDIAARCGFNDLRRFRLVFTKHEGVSPKKIRKSSSAVSR